MSTGYVLVRYINRNDINTKTFRCLGREVGREGGRDYNCERVFVPSKQPLPFSLIKIALSLI